MPDGFNNLRLMGMDYVLMDSPFEDTSWFIKHHYVEFDVCPI